MPCDTALEAAFADLPALFRRAYGEVFASSPLDEALELVNWKVEARGPASSLSERYHVLAPTGPGAADAQRGERRAFVTAAGEFRSVPVYDRYALRAGTTVAGPALIEERESTCVVGLGDRVTVDEGDNLIAELAYEGVLGAMSTPNDTIDLVDLGIMWDRLVAITDETVSTLVRTSFSTIVRESYDLTVVLLDADGRLIAQGTYSLPVFIGTAPETLRHMLRRFPPETLVPGDVVITNDPWMGTGHLFDINVMRPVFRDGRIVAYTLSITHLPDIGGTGFGAAASEIYHEGLRLPIGKLVAGGRDRPLS